MSQLAASTRAPDSPDAVDRSSLFARVGRALRVPEAS